VGAQASRVLLMVGEREARGVRARGRRRRVGHVAAAGRHGRRRSWVGSTEGGAKARADFSFFSRGKPAKC
jgi:hypothetical protein